MKRSSRSFLSTSPKCVCAATSVYRLVACFFAISGVFFARPASAVGGNVVAWGASDYGAINVPADATNIVAVAAGVVDTFAIREDHSLLQWGHPAELPPPGTSNLISIAAGGFNCIGIRTDNSLWVWSQQSSVMNYPPEATNLVKVSAGNIHVMALRADGRVFAWGEDAWGATIVPAAATNIVDIAAGGTFSVGLRSDGVVLVWGSTGPLTLALTNIVAVGASYYSAFAVSSEGRAFVFDSDSGLSNIVAVAGAAVHWIALTKDGAIIFSGSDTQGQGTTPPGLGKVCAIDAEGEHNVALVNVPSVQIRIPPRDQSALAGDNVLLSCEAVGTLPLNYAWTRDGTLIAQTALPYLWLKNVQAGDQGTYRVIVTNANSSATSAPAQISVIPSLPRVLISATNVVGLPGATVSATATVRGTLPLALQWQKGGVNLVARTNATLTLTNIVWSDSATYQLISTNALGSVTSAPVILATVQAGIWGSGTLFQSNVPPSAAGLMAIAAGGYHAIALRNDGSVLAWGNNSWGQSTPPSFVTNILSISAGDTFSAALSSDGRPLVWGDNYYGQTNVPPIATNIATVSAGATHVLCLRQDGTVIAWGNPANGRTTVPAAATNVVSLAAGGSQSLALRSDGSVLGWGGNGYGQTTIPISVTNIVALAAGANHSLALRADGVVLAWGDNAMGQCIVPPSASNIVSIAAGGNFSMALRADGQVLGWGDTSNDRTNTPLLVTNVNAIAASSALNAALVDNGSLYLNDLPTIRTTLAGDDLVLAGSAFGKPPLAYQWFFNGVPISGATNVWLLQHDVQQDMAGSYTLVVASGSVSATNPVAAVTVTPRAPLITQQPTNRLCLPRSSTALSVSARGTATMSYQWCFNGTAISDATNSVLTLTNLQLSNAGNYQVLISNVVDIATSSVAHIDIYPFNLEAALTNATGGWSADWGDFDNDGQLDLLIAGKAGAQTTVTTARLFRNLGNGNFAETNVNFGQTVQSVVWGDFDNDGYLDALVVSGTSAKIWHNLGNGTFTNLSSTLTADSQAAASVADYNDDGRLDILLGGRLYRNLGNNQFTNVVSGLPGTQYANTAWGDYDGDGWPDVLICALAGGNAQFRLYRNLGNGTFTNVLAGFQDIYRGMGAWLDFDGDGRLDVVMSGATSAGVRFCGLYRNNGDGTFTNVASGLPAVSYAWLATGDYDNDGLPDVFLSGDTGSGNSGRLFSGNTNGLFSQIASPFPTNLAPFVAWGDYDSDGRLDLALSTMINGTAQVGVYRNDALFTNTSPLPPVSASASAGVNRINFQWSAGSDVRTPTPALTYAVRVGRSPGGAEVLSADAFTSGMRRVARPGNGGAARGLMLTNISFGRYYWAVQTVDSSFAGSVFSPEQLFVYGAATLPVTNFTSSEATLLGVLDTNRLPALAWFEWGVTTNHGNVTPAQSFLTNAVSGLVSAPIAGLLPATAYYCRLVVSNADGILSGGEQSFITTDLPQIIPLAASDITASNATLNAWVNPKGSLTGVSFDFGLTRSYGSSTAITNIGSGRNPIAVSRKIFGLIGGQIYHFRVAATNDAGAAASADISFVTTTEPEVATTAATNIAATAATLNALVRPNTLPTDVFFEYGITTNFGLATGMFSLPGSTNLFSVGIAATNLARLTTYYFRVVASNSTGTIRGTALSFKTTDDVIALPATGITMTSAILNGLVNPNGLPTTAFFEFGASTNYGAATSAIFLSGGTNLVPMTFSVTNLVSQTGYYFHVVATNADGFRSSTPQYFQTLPLLSPVDLGLSGIANGVAAWGDFDNDGKVDLLMASPTLTRLYRNLGNGGFAMVTNSIVGVSSGSVAWGDYNNDGWLDILIVGTDSIGASSRIYRNNGDGSFTDIHAALQPVGYGVGRWGDFNNDGRQDVLLVGETNGVPFSKVFRNDGGGVFTELTTSLPAFLDSHALTLDFDNDGKLDILLMGRVGIPYADVYAKLYRNLGNAVFQDTGVQLPGVRLGFGEWGDFDGDGWPDLLYGGRGTGLSDVIYLFRNNGDGTFLNLSALVTQFAPDAVHWADFDSDGRFDIFARGQKYISSQPPSNSYSAALHNNGTNSMSFTYLVLPEIWSSAGGVCDYDGDGRIDLLITGNSRTGNMTRFYHNNWPQTNSSPTAPSQTSNLVSGNSVYLSWGRGTDAESPPTGLSYNLRVGQASGGVEVVSPLSQSSGYRRVVAPGNMGEATSITLTNLSPSVYYWSVQTIDAAFAGSSFGPEMSFVVSGTPFVTTLPPTNVSASSATLLGTVTPNGSMTSSYFEWGVDTNLGQMTTPVSFGADFATNLLSSVLTNLGIGTVYSCRIVASNSVGVAYGQICQVQTIYPPTVKVAQAIGNSIEITFTASTNSVYSVYGSTNLTNWKFIGYASAIGTNLFRFADPVATNMPAKFYRVSAP